MTATIPTMQYGNIQPTFDVEAPTYEQAVELGLQRMKFVWDRTGEKPLDIARGTRPAPVGEILTCWASGTQVYFDPVEHVYRDSTGYKWLGGSTFAGRYKSEFAASVISKKMADKNGVNAKEILAMWALNAEASATFGTSVHAALQLRGQFAELSRAVKDGGLDSALTTNPVLRPIVEAFFETRAAEVAMYECFVADGSRRHCGLIDRLVIEEDGSVWVEDYKTNAEILKAETIKAPFKGIVPNTALGAYWLQLSFYARILQAHGKTVNGLRIHHWTADADGTYHWVTYGHPVVDLDGAFQAEADKKG